MTPWEELTADQAAAKFLLRECRLRQPFGLATARLIARRRTTRPRPWVAWLCPTCHRWHPRPVPTDRRLEQIARAMRGLDPYKDPVPHQ